MTQNMTASDSADRYQTKRLPGGLIRVVDLENDRVDGVWDQNDKVWFDVHGFLQAQSGETDATQRDEQSAEGRE